MIRALSNWDAHTSATEEEGRCEKFGNNCPFMGKMPGLVKISLGGASGGNDNNDDTGKDKNNEFSGEDSDNNRRIDGVADLKNQSDGVNDNENDGEYEPFMVHDEDVPESDAEDEVENESCKKYCCFF